MLPRIPLLLAFALFAGCASKPALREQHALSPAATPSIEMIQGAQIGRYILALRTLVQGNPTAQAEVMADARAGYDQAKLGPAAVFYGLLLAAPGHPLRDAAQAQRVLSESLSRPELLTMVERALAVVELKRVEDELRLVTEKDRLVAEAQQERERQRTAPSIPALNKRLQSEIDENARLRKALDEARAKLDAIAELERRISDRQPPAEGRKP